MRGSEPVTASGWLADTHAHLYSCFPIQRYIESAISNSNSGRSGRGSAWAGCLLVAETAADSSFERLVDLLPRSLPGGYVLQSTSEPASFVVTAGGSAELVLIGGRQMVTAEGLEVLLFGGAAGSVADGDAADTVLEQAAGRDSVAIVPWGFGKWWFGRGRVVRRLVRDHAASLALGDNGGRPAVMPEPGVFRLARSLDVPVLAGSDPLPLPSQAERVGSYGVVLPCTPDYERPATQIISLLRARPAVTGGTYGSRVGVAAFIAAQARLRALRPMDDAERAGEVV